MVEGVEGGDSGGELEMMMGPLSTVCCLFGVTLGSVKALKTTTLLATTPRLSCAVWGCVSISGCGCGVMLRGVLLGCEEAPSQSLLAMRAMR